ncbi:MAG: hypothetical protein IKX19_05860 [Clostridia bacterium]|nr:hypothetical protein [Clostridia bacterium]MBR5680162.1 hypothetical protein [Clostridia bacterium]
MKKKETKREREEMKEEGRTKIIVTRIFGDRDFLDLYADYAAEMIRRKIAESAKTAG